MSTMNDGRQGTARDVGKPIETDWQLLKVEEAALRLGIGRSKVYDLIASGELRSVRIGASRRLPVSEVKGFIVRMMDPPHDVTPILHSDRGGG